MILVQDDLRDALIAVASGLEVTSSTNEAELERIRLKASSCGPLVTVSQAATSLIDEQGYVQIVGIPIAQARPLFLGLATLLGAVFIDPAEENALIGAHVRPQQHLMGNQVRALPLHTDYSMMQRPPRLTMSLCTRADRMTGFGSLSVADVEAMVFGLDGDDDVVRFKRVMLPFAARTIGDQVEVIESPIICMEHDGRLVARYHKSRIVQGFRHRNQSPTAEQAKTMRAFEKWIRESVQIMSVDIGYITILDNHRMVHGRERCSVELALDGTTQGRQMLFAFAY